MVLSAALRKMIGVAKDAVFVGKGNRFQIWEPSVYESELKQIKEWGSAQENPHAKLYRTAAEG